MGRPRGKSKKAIEARSNDDEDSSGGEEVPPPTPKRRGRPHKPLKDVTDDAEKDAAEVEDDADGTKPVVRRPPIKDSIKKQRRRRRRQERSPSESAEEDEEDHVRSKSSGFRPNGSRRKSTPRRAAEAGVECK
ncbi:unnamed protein product [Urochloa humidicola]